MTVMYSRDEPLSFGKHAESTIRELLDGDPRYVVWLWREKVIEFHKPEDQDWFERTAAHVADDEDEREADLMGDYAEIQDAGDR